MAARPSLEGRAVMRLWGRIKRLRGACKELIRGLSARIGPLRIDCFAREKLSSSLDLWLRWFRSYKRDDLSMFGLRPLIAKSESEAIRLLKRCIGDLVEVRTMGCHELTPCLDIPDFRMVVHSKQDHVAFQPRQFRQSLRNSNSSLGIEINFFRLRIKEPFEGPELGWLAGIPCDLASEPFKTCGRVDCQ